MSRSPVAIAPMTLLIIVLGSPAVHADSDVSIGIHVDIPALVYPEPPPMVWYPELGVYIALGSPHRLFFYMGDYFYFRDGVWYIAFGYGGPWQPIERHRLPPHLHKFKDHDWPRYQHDAEGYYRRGYRHEHPPFPAWHDRHRGDEYGHDRERNHDRRRDHEHKRD